LRITSRFFLVLDFLDNFAFHVVCVELFTKDALFFQHFFDIVVLKALDVRVVSVRGGCRLGAADVGQEGECLNDKKS
jgi:hypothetical protein